MIFKENETFKDKSLNFGKDNPKELVIFKNCVFYNVRINFYSGKIKFYNCKFEHDCKIQEVNLDAKRNNKENFIDLVEVSTRTFGHNLEVIGTKINLTRPKENLKGLKLTADVININANDKILYDINITFNARLCVNDGLLVNATLEKTSEDAETHFSSCYINDERHPFKMIEIDIENAKQKKLK